MAKRSKTRLDPFADDDDVEAIADAALGLDDATADMAKEELKAHYRRLRERSVGAQLTARQLLSDRRKRRFIKALAESGSVSRACVAAGWSPSTAKDQRKRDPMFAKCWEDAMEFAADVLEDEARRRGVEGVLKPVYQQGRQVGYVREYSDSLLTTLLKGAKPDRYSNGKLEVSAVGGVLVVPGRPQNEREQAEWEAELAAQQAEHRGHTGEDDPLA